MEIIAQFGTIPIDSATLLQVFADYRSPKDKIAGLVKSGTLIRLKKGLFVVSPALHKQVLSKELMANHLYGPSCLSLESALSWYGLIPERVHAIRSVTPRRSKQYTTPLGLFDFVTVPEAYYSTGIRQEIVNNQYAFLIAAPEKALCDMVVTTPGLRLQSVKAVQNYLENDLRIDFSAIATYDTDIIKQCIATGRKRTELTQLLHFLKQ